MLRNRVLRNGVLCVRAVLSVYTLEKLDDIGSSDMKMEEENKLLTRNARKAWNPALDRTLWITFNSKV